MIQHRRLTNQVMSAKARKLHTVTVSIADADNLVKEFDRLQQEHEDIKRQLAEAKTSLAAVNNTITESPLESAKPDLTEKQFSGILDGGKF